MSSEEFGSSQLTKASSSSAWGPEELDEEWAETSDLSQETKKSTELSGNFIVSTLQLLILFK